MTVVDEIKNRVLATCLTLEDFMEALAHTSNFTKEKSYKDLIEKVCKIEF